MSTVPGGPEAQDPAGAGRHAPDWGRFGLSEDQVKESEKLNQESYHHHTEGGTGGPQRNELFAQDSASRSKPWWQTNFFISEPVLFGTWDGVFTSCMINIFGIIIFLRTGWMVGNAGIGFSVLVIVLTIAVALIAALSAIGVCEQSRMESGGVYFLLSHVMGAKFGASVGILYCFGQAVACSLYVIGFGESISSLIDAGDNKWITRGIATGVVLLLLGINVAGVKWVIRVQLVLLIILFVAVLDFLVGSFVHSDPKNGFEGYHGYLFSDNTGPSYLSGESFFTVFGVFFPTATGVFAGINMSGDLRNPARNIPVGTLSAVGVSTFLYLAFAVVLGGTCTRSFLQTDYMMAERVSIVGVLFLAGLYISSISSCMGGLYGSPRILQCIANENVIPIIKVLGNGRGPNKVPVYALCVITSITLLFIFIGDVNTLGPIVTMPFMLTYAAVDYCYFALSMSFKRRRTRDARFGSEYSRVDGGKHSPSRHNYGATKTQAHSGADLDKLFPERSLERDGSRPRHGSSGGGHDGPGLESPTFVAPKSAPGDPQTQDCDDTAGLLTSKPVRPQSDEITHQPHSFYSPFCNHWVSLLGAVASLVIMFSIRWYYALANVFVFLKVYIYIGQFNPGVSPGIAEFNIIEWLRDGFRSILRRGPEPSEQIVVTPNTPAMRTMAAQLTEENEDFAERERYHQSEIVKGENFDDYQD